VSETEQPACRNCRFWGTLSDPAECRRRAPVNWPDSNWSGGRKAWPITQRNDWCGDYEPKLGPLRASRPSNRFPRMLTGWMKI
jgi:hypothetical protein